MSLKNPIQQLTNNLRERVAESKVEDNRLKLSYDHTIFKKHPWNRDVNTESSHFEELTKSIQNHNMLSVYPILVDEKMRVIDGQHRLEVAKKLQIPIYYQVYNKLEETDMLNLNVNQKKWELKDYLHFYCQRGNEDYIQFREFIAKEGFKIVEGLLALQDGQKRGSSGGFQKGLLKYPKGEELRKVEQRVANYQKAMELLLKKSLDVPKYIHSSNFRTALLRFVGLKAVDMDYFLTRLELKLENIRMTTSTGGYLLQFEAIYNYNTKGNKLDLNKEIAETTAYSLIQTSLI